MLLLPGRAVGAKARVKAISDDQQSVFNDFVRHRLRLTGDMVADSVRGTDLEKAAVEHMGGPEFAKLYGHGKSGTGMLYELTSAWCAGHGRRSPPSAAVVFSGFKLVVSCARGLQL